MSAWIQQAAQWSWQNSIAAGALAVLVLGLRRAARGRIAPRWLCLAGWLVMVRLFLPVPMANPWAWDRAWSREKMTATAQPVVSPPPERFSQPLPKMSGDVPAIRAALEPLPLTVTAEPSPPGERMGEPRVPENEPAIMADKLSAAEPVVVSPAPQVVVETKATAVDWLLAGTWLWASGTLGFLFIVIVRHSCFMRRLMSVARDLSAQSGFTHRGLEARATAEECARLAGLRVIPQLLAVPGGGSPFLCGLRRPQIVLPADTLAALTREELRHVLLHEMLHIARRDLAANWLLIAARALHWWNPLIHLTARRLLADRELLRDRQAVALLRDPAERAAYGHTLLKLALPPPAPALSPGLAPFFRTEKELHRRLTMLQSPLHRPRLAACAAALTLTCVAAPVFSTAQEKEGKDESVAASPAISAAEFKEWSNRFQFLPAYATTPGGADAGKEEGLIQFSGHGRVSLEIPEGKAIQTLSPTEIAGTLATGAVTGAPDSPGKARNPIAASTTADLNALRSRLRVLQSIKGQQLVAVMYALGEGNEQFTRLCNESRDENGQLTVCLWSGFGPKHPKIKGLKAAIAVKNEQLEKLAQQYVEALELQLKGAEAIGRDEGRTVQTPQGIIVQFNAPEMSSEQARALEKSVREIFDVPPDSLAPVKAATENLQQLRTEIAEMKAALASLQAAGGERRPSQPTVAWSTNAIEAAAIAEALKQAAPRAEAVKPTDQAGENLPWGVAVPGRKGHVFTPYSPDSAVVDVTGFKKGDKVKCPHTGNFFRVP